MLLVVLNPTGRILCHTAGVLLDLTRTSTSYRLHYRCVRCQLTECSSSHSWFTIGSSLRYCESDWSSLAGPPAYCWAAQCHRWRQVLSAFIQSSNQSSSSSVNNNSSEKGTRHVVDPRPSHYRPWLCCGRWCGSISWCFGTAVWIRTYFSHSHVPIVYRQRWLFAYN